MANRRRNGPGFLGGPLEKPLIALQAAITSDALIKAISALVQRAVSCDFLHVYLRIEPHAYGAVAYRLLDTRGRDFSAQLSDGSFFQDHPTMPILMANPGIRFINTRGTLPSDEILHASRFYREVMQCSGSAIRWQCIFGTIRRGCRRKWSLPPAGSKESPNSATKKSPCSTNSIPILTRP